jgi:L-alanine-DL-glutamate epimerase-like enolase superfamily enzyme
MVGAVGSIAIPHNWASQIGIAMGLHLARALPAVPMAECDRSTCDVLVTNGFQLHEGRYQTLSAPGLGITIDEDVYRKKCQPGEIVVA